MNPTRSTNNTETSFRSSAAAGRPSSMAPQALQKRAPSGFSVPQLAQLSTTQVSDAAPTRRRIANVFANHRTTFTDQAGASVTSVRGALERRVIDDDGSFIRMSAGLSASSSCSGLVAVNTGLLVVTFDAVCSVTDIRVTPTRDGRIANFICPYLT